MELKESDLVPISTVINNVKKMATDSQCRKIASSESLSINTVSYEDCARNKFSVWGPCISDMTLQVNDKRMPVIREPNYTDKTWDVETDKIPLVIGNQDPNPGAKLKTISLREYLENFNDYMSTPPKNKEKINLIANDMFAKQSDKHVIMSSQCCFLPIEKGKETKFNVALFNYQSKKSDPAVLVIVSTSKGTSAQIIEGNEQKLLFNNYGRKADFIGQRLTDNRIERNVSIHGPMTKQEKQDNCIVIIQIPLKQKPKQVHVHSTQYEYNYYPQYQSYPSYPSYPQYPQPQFPPPIHHTYLQNHNLNLNYSINNNNMNDDLFGCMFGGGGSGGGGAQAQQLQAQQQQYVQQQQQQQQQQAQMGYMGSPPQHHHSAQSTSANFNNNNNNGFSDFAMSNSFSSSSSAQPQAMNGSMGSSNNYNNSAHSHGHHHHHHNNNKKNKKKNKKKQDANVEAAIVKIAPKTIPVCSCGGNLEEIELRHCYPGTNGGGVSCDGCSKSINGIYTKVWHCPKEKTTYKHSNGYDLCKECGEKQLTFDELNGLKTIERDTRYPIRVTLQYYKSTDNGILTRDIMKAIKNLLEKSQKQADYIGSLVTDYTIRSTEPDLITKNKTQVIHHVNKVKVNVPVPVNPNPFISIIQPQPVVVIEKQYKKIVKENDPFEGIVNDMKEKVNHGKYSKIASVLKDIVEKEDDRNKYLMNFKNEEVTDEDLKNLCRDDLLELIPKMGPRNRFLKWLQSEYPKDNSNNTNFMSGFL